MSIYDKITLKKSDILDACIGGPLRTMIIVMVVMGLLAVFENTTGSQMLKMTLFMLGMIMFGLISTFTLFERSKR